MLQNRAEIQRIFEHLKYAALALLLIASGCDKRQSQPNNVSAKSAGTATEINAPNVTHDQGPEEYQLIRDPLGEFGIRALFSVTSMTQAADASGDIDGSVGALIVGSTAIPLKTNAIAHEGSKAYIVTKEYGKIRVSGGYAGDHPPSGICFWLTPSQQDKLRRLKNAK